VPDTGGPGAAHQLQAGQRLVGLCGVDDLDRESHVDEHPLAGARRRVQHADVDPPLTADHVDERELIGVAGHDLDDPAGDAQTHGQYLPLAAG
jgi:hypothetical protein